MQAGSAAQRTSGVPGASAPGPLKSASGRIPVTKAKGAEGAGSAQPKSKATQGELVQAALVPSPLPLVDIGGNLTDSSFDKDRGEVMARACAANVCAIMCTGGDLRGTAAARRLCEQEEEAAAAAEAADGGVPVPRRLYFTAGVHPHNAKNWTDASLDELRRLSSHPRCVAIGECGLDYDRDFSPRPVQLAVFEKQVVLAKELGKPLFMHCREAGPAFVEVLRRHQPVTGVVHCFTGSKEDLLPLLELDLHIGITGWVCDTREGRDVALASLLPLIPRNRLMIETDAPYLTPRTITPSKARPSRNEPALLPLVLTAIAAALGCTVEEAALSTTETATRLFGMAPLAPATGAN